MHARTWTVCALLACAAPSAGAFAQSKAKPAASSKLAAEDSRARAAWGKLSADEQRESIEYLKLECSRPQTFRSDLVAFALTLLDQERSAYPAEEPAPHFDPAQHAPAQPIARHTLSTSAAAVAALRKAIDAKIPPRALKSAWRYDYGLRTLRRASDVDDPARVFENTIAGYPPDFDLAEALIERALDDGSQQKQLAAFAHAYTDRDGGVYPGITLYDAWTSGAELEMPDVDVLGIIHDVFDDWKTWTAPVAGPAQQPLYERIGKLYIGAHRHKSLRCAIARAFLDGDAVLRDGYQGVLSNFHALWESAKSTPSELVPKLPRPDDNADWIEKWIATCKKQKAVFQAGLVRQKTLGDDSKQVRAAGMRMLTDFRAYERLDAKASAPTAPANPH